MTSLRMRVVEAGARALYAQDGGRVEIWDNIGDELRRANREKSAAALDAMLDCLTENRSDWADWNAAECADDGEGCNCVSDDQVLGLLQALREDR